MVIISFSKVAFQLKFITSSIYLILETLRVEGPDSNLLTTVETIASEERYHLIVVQGIHFKKTTIK